MSEDKLLTLFGDPISNDTSSLQFELSTKIISKTPYRAPMDILGALNQGTCYHFNRQRGLSSGKLSKLAQGNNGQPNY
jgi:hypothetical protein